MTYWHIQMFKEGLEATEQQILQEKQLIGLGYANQFQTEQFINSMNIGDIVLVRRGNRPKALVRVIGEIEDIGENNFEQVDWFQYRRRVEVLDYATEEMSSFPQPRGTLQKSINKYTPTYQYIEQWHKNILNPTQLDKGFKIHHLTIADYKMFQEFKVNFIYKEEPLSLVVIAGKNGTGKTTLLEAIQKRDHAKITFQNDGQVIEHGGSNYDEFFDDNIIYLDAMIENDNDIEALILAYIDYFIYDRNENAIVGAENLQKDMDEIFKGFKLNFHFKKIDYKSKKPIFGAEDAVRDDIEFTLKDLSTGERTLLSKVLYLYLEEPKDKIILIDEPETSLHPAWQNRILKFYENFAKINNNQIIIATHSPQIIGSAKNEYLRILKKSQDGKVKALSNLIGYGRDIEWVLEEVMGIKYTREKAIVKKLERCQNLINNELYDEAEEAIDALEEIIGEHDSEILTLRNSLAFERMDFEQNVICNPLP